MTNEQLAGFIKQGGNDELIPLLWENVKKLMYMYADKFYSSHKDQCDQSGVTAWDIKQECYAAFLKAIEGYKEEQGYQFTTYINYPFKNAVNNLLGLNGRNKNLLNECISLNAPITDNDSTSISELGETIPDTDSQQVYDNICENDVYRVVRAAVSKLRDTEREVITLYYFKNLTIKSIAEIKALSSNKISQIRKEALMHLKRMPELKPFKEEYVQAYYTYSSWFYAEAFGNR